MKYRVGIDVGGTFTDLALVSEAGDLHIFKVPTRPKSIADGCLDGLGSLLREAGVAPGEIGYWSHGSTVATNAVVEGKGARTALLATEGFRDILEIRRQIKPDRYNLHHLKPEPLVPRERRLEVTERTAWDGSELIPLNEAQLDAVLDRLTELEVEAVAIAFLHSYANPAHEQAVLQRVRQRLPNVYVTASHEALPEFREYPRTATTVINAYVGPVMQRYLERFNEGGKRMGVGPPLNIFQSNGGIASASSAARFPLRVLYSGPAAGVRGCTEIARQSGVPNLITFDMGGTSTDVCLIRDSTPLTFMEREVAGFPVRTPMIDVHSIGAGGGSIAWIDKGGLLHVGPHSAGADPGPAAYGRGGAEPTVTDANVVLGRINPQFLLGGRLEVYADRARMAVEGLASRLGRTVEEVALGIVEVVNSNMMGAIRVVSVERGQDFRDCTLMALGGAGPLHAAEVARDIGIGSVLVPAAPGIMCAMGLLFADYQSDFTRTHIIRATSGNWEQMRAVISALEEQASAWSAEHGIPTEGARLEHYVHARSVGQSYQLQVPTSSIERPGDVDRLLEDFHAAHQSAYGFSQSQIPVEVVDFQLSLIVPVPRPNLRVGQDLRAGSVSEALVGERPVWFKSSGAPISTPVYQRNLLPLKSELRGPAILEQVDSTTVVPPGVTSMIDTWGNVRLTIPLSAAGHPASSGGEH